MAPHPPFKEVEASRPDFDDSSQHTVTKVPQPDWQPGGGLNNLPDSEQFKPENAKWRVIDPNDLEKPQLYKLMISGITPRPIAFLSTKSPEGKCNLAPFSYFNMISHNPPTIMVSIQSNPKNPSGLKDSAYNIRETKEFCVSIISEPFLEAANVTSIDLPPEMQEWDLSGLTKRKSESVDVPHVAEAAFSMECTLQHWYELRNDAGELSNTVVLGRIRRFQTKEFIFDPEDKMKVLAEKLRPVSRLGGITYARSTQYCEVPRPAWADVKDLPEYKAAIEKGTKQIE